ncbi:hypothetical protein HZH66_002711 [Vespula vulgaris]|uniref:Uncharacterized protein n=1 Tax=Vespula vulgaris TaxID=7454 RepID=A0A834KHN7_VESVU|nr:hypothetical protein HZH66_002711 [Vespula vulgaris]
MAKMLYTTIRVVERTVEWHTFRKLALQKNTICDKHMMDDEKIIFSDERDDTTCLNVCEMLLSDVKAF